MRKVINKNLTEAEILNAAEMMLGEGVGNLKFYFMLGLPEERDEDVLAIADLVARVLERARARRTRIGSVTVSLNPFVPKPWTPFQWDRMEDGRSIKRKVAMLRARLTRLGQVELDAESPREAYFQTMVSRGDRRVAGILERLEAAGLDGSGPIWHELVQIHREVEAGDSDLPDPDFFVTRHYTHDELLPWDFIDHHIFKCFLLPEPKKPHHDHQSPPSAVVLSTLSGASSP